MTKAGSEQRPAANLAFDLCGPLPSGTVALQASAGTGKTYAVAALAARYVAEGVAELGDLMIVTFSRLATQELRDRVRQRLVSLAFDLGAVIAGADVAPPTDPVSAFVCAADIAELRRRHARLLEAIARFDGATIATTHEFCDRMLRGLGILSDHDPGTRLVENIDSLIRQTVSDEYLRRYSATGSKFSFEAALVACRAAMQQPATALVPRGASGDTAERVAFVAAVREEVESRKRRLGIYTFDDMLLRLRDALVDPKTGEAGRARLRALYPVVIVDEFQDTDPVQWQIIKEAFVGHSTVVLIGDPKQSIYGFRGADVQAYLEAMRSADRVESLDTNHRSDQKLVNAVQAVFDGAALGDLEIRVNAVQAHHQTGRLRCEASDAWQAPMRLRVLAGRYSAGAARDAIDADLCADIVALLKSKTTLQTPDGDWRRVRPSDVAVLVAKNGRGQAIQAALARCGVPAVFAGAASVFQTPAASEWLTLLRALDQPRTRNVRRAALTSLVGWDFKTLAAADDEALGALTSMLRRWARLLSGPGVAALYEVALHDAGLPERLLAHEGGERLLTDLRHLAEALNAEQHARRLGPASLVAWLEERIEDARARGDEERSRRLETDAEAVTITTVHQAKGLEYPVVYLPEASDRYVPDDDDDKPISFHESGVRVLDVGGQQAAGRRERRQARQAEEAAESLRSLYVAMTRASCHLTVWWAETMRNTSAAALQRLLFRDRATPMVPDALPVEKNNDPAQLRHLVSAGVSVEAVAPRASDSWVPAAATTAAPTLATFAREIDLRWRRTSYSALTASAHETAGLEVGIREPDEAPIEEQAPTPDLAAAGLRPSPMADLPSGTVFGSLVHAVFEFLDPTQGTLEDSVRKIVAAQSAKLPIAELDVDALTKAMLPGLLTPLGPLADQACLAAIPARDRLAELNFELRLDADPKGRAACLRDVADLLGEHLAPDDPLADYPSRLKSSGLADHTLLGFLNGSIDAVLRVGEPRRHLVVDYKTNRLAPFDVPLTLAHYDSAGMAAAMQNAHYPLQAIFYLVATHRYLKWRLPGYEPDRDLGGALYLFVRGMAGPDNPVLGGMGAGVFAWSPPTGLIVAVSDLLAGSPSGGSRRRSQAGARR